MPLRPSGIPLRQVDLSQTIPEAVKRFGGIDADFYLFGSRRHRSGSVRSDLDILCVTERSLDERDAEVLWDLEPYLDVFVADRGIARSLINGSTIRASDTDELIQLLDAVQIADGGGWHRSADDYSNHQVLADRSPAATNATLYELYDAIPAARADILVVTALSEEYRAVVEAFGGDAGLPSQRVEVQDSGGAPWLVALRNLNEMGSVGSALVTYSEILRSKPRHVVLVGICAGIPSRSKLLDVVVPRSVDYYEPGKVLGRGIDPASHVVDCSDRVRLAISTLDTSAIQEEFRVPNVRAEGEILACGEKVVASKRFRSALAKKHRKIAAIDMESYGVARAARELGCEFTVVKSICDMADRHKADGAHQPAREAAAGATLSFLRAGAFREVR